ncbi:MAG TPA: hypothetical protein VMW89_00420 [Desulfatiglandales bacterium]|nr:hypothetical protein [Desulfatiglandales bacterium]
MDQKRSKNVPVLFFGYSGLDETGGMVVFAGRCLFGHQMPVAPWGDHDRWSLVPGKRSPLVGKSAGPRCIERLMKPPV